MEKKEKNYKVLILILVEVALGVFWTLQYLYKNRGLNPYFSGSCSWRVAAAKVMVTLAKSLNPYFSGSCSWSLAKTVQKDNAKLS